MFSLWYEIFLQHWKTTWAVIMMNYRVNYTHTTAEFELLKHDYDSFWRGKQNKASVICAICHHCHRVKVIPIDFMQLAFTAPSRRFHTHNKYLIIVKHVPDKRAVSCSIQSCLFKPSGWCLAALPTYAGSRLPTVEQKPRAKKGNRKFLLWGSNSAHVSVFSSLALSSTDIQTDNGQVSLEISLHCGRQLPLVSGVLTEAGMLHPF